MWTPTNILQGVQTHLKSGVICICFLIVHVIYDYNRLACNYLPISRPTLTVPLSSILKNTDPWPSAKFMEELNQEFSVEAHNFQNLSPKISCDFPSLEPFNPEINHILMEKLGPLNCETETFPLIFNSAMKPYPRLYPVKNAVEIRAHHRITSCCMREIIGFKGGYANGNIAYGNKCLPLSLYNGTKVPEGWNFVVVECQFLRTFRQKGLVVVNSRTRRKIDVHFFLRQSARKAKVTNGDANTAVLPNVLILALDATSRLAFRRSFPEVHEYLVKNLSALEFKGYNKVGANTFSNIGPMLTNRRVVYTGDKIDKDMILGCETDKLQYDRCPFIWKEYRIAGYKTLYAEDYGKRDQFYKWRGGFVKQPTDYFLKPFTTAAQESIGHDGSGKLSNYGKCFGPRSAFQVLMSYLESFAGKMEFEKSPYFGFAMSDTATHDYVNGGQYIQNDLLAMLQLFEGKGYLNNTVFILLSDHGHRTGEMRNHFQGYLEDRLPFMYFVVPDWFQKMYPGAYENMKKNANERLVTPFDINEVLADLLPFSKLRFNTTDTEYPVESTVRRRWPGISLFSSIPASRTCESAGIIKAFCACNLKRIPISTKNKTLIEAAGHVVSQINELVVKTRDSKCTRLKLNASLVSAEAVISTRTNITELYRIVFETYPGNANFEAMLNFHETKKVFYGKCKMIGTP